MRRMYEIDVQMRKLSAQNYSALPPCLPSNKYDPRFNSLGDFEAAMDSEEAGMDCGCLPNCEEVIFKTQVSQLNIRDLSMSSQQLGKFFPLDIHKRL